MADDADRRRVAAVIGDGLVGDIAPAQMGADVGRHAAAVDAPRQFVHAPIDRADQAAEQIGASARTGRRFGRRGLAGAGEAHCRPTI